MPPHDRSLCLIVRVGADRVAVRQSDVARILPLVRITPVSSAVPGQLGVIDVEGDLLPVLDGAFLLAGAQTDLTLDSRMLLTTGAAAPRVVVVDAVETVKELDVGDADASDALSRSVGRTEEGDLLPVLDLDGVASAGADA